MNLKFVFWFENLLIVFLAFWIIICDDLVKFIVVKFIAGTIYLTELMSLSVCTTSKGQKETQ